MSFFGNESILICIERTCPSNISCYKQFHTRNNMKYCSDEHSKDILGSLKKMLESPVWVTIFELKQKKSLSASHGKNKKTRTRFLILMFIMKVSPNQNSQQYWLVPEVL